MIAGVSQLSHGGGGYNETDIPLSAQPNPCILKAYAYGQDLTINEQVLEPFELIETFKDAVETAAIALGSPSDPFAPANRTEAGLSASASDTIGHYFSSVSIHDGAIIVTYDGDDVNQAIWGDELVWTPHVSPDGTISWLCGYAYELTGTQPMDGSPGYNSTSIEPRYLPPQCRP